MAEKKSSSLPWGLKEEKLKPNSVEELSKEKLKAFSIGASNAFMLKKSAFQKKREEKEVKKELEAKETAKVFEDFVATFDDCERVAKTFVRGTVINADSKDEGNAKQPGVLYQPSSSKLVKSAPEKKHDEEVNVPTSSQKKKKIKTEKKKSILELFGEELKRMHEERNDPHAMRRTGEPLLQAPSNVEKEKVKVEDYPGLPKGSVDNSDPLTTNLYVGNINPKMTEEMMCQHFGKFGPLASIKIMWPRTEEEKSRNKNCGFVAFMKREDAEKALEAMKGSSIMGYEVQVGWGKTVPLPPKPFYVAPNKEIEEKKFVPDPHSGLPFNAQSFDESSKPLPGGHYGNVPPPTSEDVIVKPSDEHSFEEVLYKSVIRVVVPSDKEIICLIHRMIEFVIREGPMFEAMIMNKEIGNPKFRFLFDNTSTDHIYYRWKLFSILQGDSPETWCVEDFRMFNGGSLWKPPPLKNLRGKVIPPIMEIVKTGQLTAEARDSLESLLRNITMERSKIMECMIWCIDHADSAEEVSDCLCESLCLQETPLPLKIARLYLVNDILQNTNARNASRYRRIFEGKVISVMEHLHNVLFDIDSRLRAEAFKRRVLKCLQAWDQLSVYHFNFVDKLREIFIGKTQEELEKKKAFETVAALMAGTNVIGSPNFPMTETPLVDDRPIDFSGGLPLEGQVVDEDVDGEPLVDPDLDGVPMEEDIDGIPIVEAETSQSHVVQSKWELVEYGNESTSDEDTDKKNELNESERSDNSKGMHSVEDQRRQFLRDVEVKVLQLVEALESSGSYTSDEIKQRAAKFRDKLQLEMKSSVDVDSSATSVSDSYKEKDKEAPARKRSPQRHTSSSRHTSHSLYSRKDHRRSRSPTSYKTKKPRH